MDLHFEVIFQPLFRIAHTPMSVVDYNVFWTYTIHHIDSIVVWIHNSQVFLATNHVLASQSMISIY